MSLLFYGASATNTFDSVGHFARNEPMVGSLRLLRQAARSRAARRTSRGAGS